MDCLAPCTMTFFMKFISQKEKNHAEIISLTIGDIAKLPAHNFCIIQCPGHITISNRLPHP